MFKITFDASSMRPPHGKLLDRLATADEMNLRYGYFQTDVYLLVSEFGEERFRGITILDFAFGLLLAAQEVRDGGVGRVGFTENDQFISFSATGQAVSVNSSWGGNLGRCNLEAFLSEISRFCESVLECIDREYPTFLENPTHSKITAMLSEFPR